MRAIIIYLIAVVASAAQEQPNPFGAGDGLHDGWLCVRSQAGKYYVGDYDTKTAKLTVYYPTQKVVDFSRGGMAKVIGGSVSNGKGTMAMLGEVETLPFPAGYGPEGNSFIRPRLACLLSRDKPMMDAAQVVVDLKAKRKALMVGNAQTRDHAALDALDAEIEAAEASAGKLVDDYHNLILKMVDTESQMIELGCAVNDCAIPNAVKQALAAK